MMAQAGWPRGGPGLGARARAGGGGGRLDEHPAGPDRGRGLAGGVTELAQDGGRGGPGDLDAVLAQAALERGQGRTADRPAEAAAAETSRRVLGARLERSGVTGGEGPGEGRART